MSEAPRGFHDVKLKSGTKTHSAFSNVNQATLSSKKFSRVIFFLHGFPDNYTSFNGVMPIVKSEFKTENVLLLAPAMRGYEKSSHHDNEGAYRTSEVAKDVYNFVHELGLEKLPVHLVGHDWGAIIAFKTASLYPDLITSIITLAIPYLSNLHAWDYLWYAPEQIYLSSYFLTMQRKLRYGKLYEKGNDNSYLNYLWEYWSPNFDYPKKEIESVRSTLLADDSIEHATAYYRCLFTPSYIKDVKWYVDFNKVSALIMGGATDGCMSPKLFELEKRRLAKFDTVEVELVPKVGHFLQREDPIKVAGLVIDFLHKYKN